jgi:hypothetical protein
MSSGHHTLLRADSSASLKHVTFPCAKIAKNVGEQRRTLAADFNGPVAQRTSTCAIVRRTVDLAILQFAPRALMALFTEGN